MMIGGHHLEMVSTPDGMTGACSCGDPGAAYEGSRGQVSRQHQDHLHQVRFWAADVIRGGDDSLPAGLAGTCVRVLAILDYPATAADIRYWLDRHGKHVTARQVTKALRDASELSLVTSKRGTWQLTVATKKEGPS